MLRLLNKRDIDSAKARDKSQAVAEGLKLTKRIDGLRELTAETEASYEKFRNETLQAVQKEIDRKIDERDALDPLIEKKKQELLTLSGPLDQAWMYYVKSEKARIDETRSALASRVVELGQKTAEYTSLTAETAKERESYLEGQENNATLLKEARTVKAEAEQAASEARNKASALLQEAENKLNQAKKREESTKTREQNVLLHEQTLKRKEDELETREMNALAKELLYYSPVTKKP